MARGSLCKGWTLQLQQQQPRGVDPVAAAAATLLYKNWFPRRRGGGASVNGHASSASGDRESARQDSGRRRRAHSTRKGTGRPAKQQKQQRRHCTASRIQGRRGGGERLSPTLSQSPERATDVVAPAELRERQGQGAATSSAAGSSRTVAHRLIPAQSAMERLALLFLLVVAVQAAVREREDPPSAGCQLGAKLFGHGARVPRSDPCERCLCFAAQVICWQERCPNQTRAGCRERRMPGVCCPALECSDAPAPEKAGPAVAEAAAAAAPDPIQAEPVVVEATLHEGQQHPGQQGCVLGGQRFALGDLVPRASGPCMQCRCADGPRLLCRATPCGGPVMLGSSSPRRPPPPTHTVRRITPTLVLP
ncbi:uncharacterized protein LOC119463906 [Dermacentor silvarum]|uniref:uncharacterized protein LOC119463906 n=1 Tax=Dermacentor silvarum TaxID=543639 RepID=UPI00189899F1|nr:uncharacterized protein LOC119463906 [Dermacentor silvarum]